MISIEKFIAETNNAKTSQDVFNLFQLALAEIGYDRICYSLITDHPSLNLKAGHGVLRNYPDEWMQHYMSKGYQHVDPVPKHCFQTQKPFTWDGLGTVRTLSTNEKQVMNEAREALLLNGVGVPLHGIHGELAGVGLASSSGGTELNKDTLSKIQTLALQFHTAYSDHGMPPSVIDHVTLTPREKEILLWAAEGKSDQIIGDIIGLSHATVRYHMNNIFKKLDANERTLAVVKAIRLGLILPAYIFK